MNWAALFGSKAVLEAENQRLRRVLADRDARVAELSTALDDVLDREQMHALSAPHEQLTSAAWIDRVGQARARHLEQPVRPARGSEERPAAHQLMTSLEATAAGATVGVDRRRSR
ncbi:hypothetical protein ACFXPR_18925 [Nocardia tengchongensis]|uniref:hypothetical protein n=1 Tax=Nocardia tengchongensis TaxID=2055889 RepID=UPI0036CE2DE9